MKNKLAVFPCMTLGRQFGYSVGWLNESNYCFIWGNYKTREGANRVLRKEYPEHEIVNFETAYECYHRDNKQSNSK